MECQFCCEFCGKRVKRTTETFVMVKLMAESSAHFWHGTNWGCQGTRPRKQFTGTKQRGCELLNSPTASLVWMEELLSSLPDKGFAFDGGEVPPSVELVWVQPHFMTECVLIFGWRGFASSMMRYHHCSRAKTANGLVVIGLEFFFCEEYSSYSVLYQRRRAIAQWLELLD